MACFAINRWRLQKAKWNSSTTVTETKFIFGTRHRLNRKLFFRACQYIRDREKTEKRNKNRRVSLSSFFWKAFAGSIYTAAQSFHKRTDVCSPFALFLFFQLITERRIHPSIHPPTGVRACLYYFVRCTQRIRVCFCCPVYFCHRAAAAHFRRTVIRRHFSSPAVCAARTRRMNKEWPDAPENALRKIEPVI